MLQATYDQLTERVNNDLTGFFTLAGFAYIGRCNCDNCLQDKYSDKKYLLKVCRQRREFSLYYLQGSNIFTGGFEHLLNTLNTHGIIEII